MGEKKHSAAKLFRPSASDFQPMQREILFNRVREIYYKKERNLFPFHVNYTP